MQVSTLSGVSDMAPPSRFQLAADIHAPYFPAGDAATDALARYPRAPMSAIRAPYEFDSDYEAPPGTAGEKSQASPAGGVSVTEAAGWVVDLTSGGLYGLAMALIGRLAKAATKPGKVEAGNADAQPSMPRPARQAGGFLADGSTGAYAGSNGNRPQPVSLRSDTHRPAPSHDMYRA
ncbi:hypothetical protein [Bordetella flabilis]|uniref:Uncharacterized protein n=1 Tax=Bordetella flabilis TaxID=463014 RepID=A0A193GIF8_9BORD|nr:hypothetical protein [Bordetella flabilis]ANN79378.1 hypothetical protein BAU07_21625 [Bordetella flabilis]